MLEAVGVDADDLARAVEHRRARRAGAATARCARGRRGSGGPRGPVERRLGRRDLAPHGAPPVAAGGHGDDDVARRRRRPSDHSSGVTSPVSTSSTTRSPSTSLPAIEPWAVRPSANVDLGRVVAQVVGVGQDLAGGDDEAGAPAAAPDGDDGGRRPSRSRSGSARTARRWRPWSHSSFARGVTIESLVTLHSRRMPVKPDALDAAARRIGDRWSLRDRRRPARRRAHVRRAGRRDRRHRPDDPHRPPAVAAGLGAGHRDAVRAPAAAHALRPDRARPAPRRGDRLARRVGRDAGRATPTDASTPPAARPSRPARGARRATARSTTRRATT